jgi:uncharacterized protein YjbI with pentapeptide repeats
MKLRKDFINQVFEDSYDVKGFDFSNADLRDINFIRANLEGADFRGSNLKGANFEDALLEGAKFEGANLEGANLEGVILRHSTFNQVSFKRCNFKLSDFTATVIYKGNLERANFQRANFRYAQLLYANLIGATMTQMELEGVDLTGADMKNADMSNSSLIEADLTDADLTNANFTGANLTGANFANANLKNANFTNANLTDANLSTATLTNCNFEGSNFEDAIIHHRTTYKILNWLLSDVDTITINKIDNVFDKVSVFDFIHGTMSISEVQDDNVIFYIQNQFQGFSFPRDELFKAYEDRSSIFVSCNHLIQRGAVSIESVIPYHLFFRLNLNMTIFLPIDSLKSLLFSKHKEWYIKDTGNVVDFSASIQVVYDNSNLNIFGDDINLVSKDHCQLGTLQKLYSLTPIEFSFNRSNGGRSKLKNKLTIKAKRKIGNRKTISRVQI